MGTAQLVKGGTHTLGNKSSNIIIFNLPATGQTMRQKQPGTQNRTLNLLLVRRTGLVIVIHKGNDVIISLQFHLFI